jgi:hypothetical protein
MRGSYDVVSLDEEAQAVPATRFLLASERTRNVALRALAELLSRRRLERPCETLVAWSRQAKGQTAVVAQGGEPGSRQRWGQSHRSSPAPTKRRLRGHSARSPLDLVELSESTVSIPDREPRQPLLSLG